MAQDEAGVLSGKTIPCPECGTMIDVSDLLYHQIEKELRVNFDDQLATERKSLEKKMAVLADERKSLNEQRQALSDEIQAAVRSQLEAERPKVEERIRSTVTEENSEQYKSMQEELERKSEQVKELNKAKADIERLGREKEELRTSIEATAEKKLSESIKEEKAKIEERVQLKLTERDSLIKQLTTQLKEAQLKAEQGSVQLQGEAQEIAIEEWLRNAFPVDEIQEVKKGVKGADCVHVVRSELGHPCGSIYYESKRTKAFQTPWIEKLKGDLRQRGADLGVIVTQTMPRGMDRMGLVDGIWVCGFEEFKGLCVVLRDMVLRVGHVMLSQESKGDKMSMLYDYLTSREFSMQVEAIVEGFTQMQTDLASEKRALQKSWAKREKQIEKVLLGTGNMYGSIRGIAGAAIPSVPQLEFDEGPPIEV